MTPLTDRALAFGLRTLNPIHLAKADCPRDARPGRTRRAALASGRDTQRAVAERLGRRFGRTRLRVDRWPAGMPESAENVVGWPEPENTPPSLSGPPPRHSRDPLELDGFGCCPKVLAMDVQGEQVVGVAHVVPPSQFRSGSGVCRDAISGLEQAHQCCPAPIPGGESTWRPQCWSRAYPRRTRMQHCCRNASAAHGDSGVAVGCC